MSRPTTAVEIWPKPCEAHERCADCCLPLYDCDRSRDDSLLCWRCDINHNNHNNDIVDTDAALLACIFLAGSNGSRGFTAESYYD